MLKSNFIAFCRFWFEMIIFWILKDAVLAAIEMWYKESMDFDYGRPDSLNSLTRNFTQMVWRDTTKLGLGVARSDSRYVFLTVSYINKQIDTHEIFKLKIAKLRWVFSWAFKELKLFNLYWIWLTYIIQNNLFSF